MSNPLKIIQLIDLTQARTKREPNKEEVGKLSKDSTKSIAIDIGSGILKAVSHRKAI